MNANKYLELPFTHDHSLEDKLFNWDRKIPFRVPPQKILIDKN